MLRSLKGISIPSLERITCFALTVFLAAASFGQAIAPVISVDHGPNAPEQISKPYVILVSLDGFRYDYAKKYHAEHLLALAKQGAIAPKGMLPSYPSITFPNHYTIVTGLYPEHHGIVSNSFYDPDRKAIYGYHDAKSVGDGTWYGGTPLWVLAEQQGMRSASFFWVGSEADIQGVRPSYYLKFDGSFPNQKRVERVLAWLHLPAEQRPHMITLYFSDTDTAGHRYGPKSLQVAEAVHELDGEIGNQRSKNDLGAATLSWKVNNLVTFVVEESMYRTRIADPTNLSKAPIYEGVPARQWHDFRSEIGPIFTF